MENNVKIQRKHINKFEEGNHVLCEKGKKEMIRKYDLIILVIGFRDYKKAYDKVSCSWLKETLKTVGVADNIPRLLRQSIYNWKTVFASNDDTLSEVSTERRIFQGCCLRYYSLLFSYL